MCNITVKLVYINIKVTMANMKPVTQLDEFGCGAACVAFLLGISYEGAVTKLGKKAAQTKGYGCQKICRALSTPFRKYRFKKFTPELKELLDQDDVIVFIKRSASYLAGHYLCRTDGQWMDPWINLPKSKDMKNAQSGFIKKLPGEPEFIIFRDPETSSG